MSLAKNKKGKIRNKKLINGSKQNSNNRAQIF